MCLPRVRIRRCVRLRRISLVFLIRSMRLVLRILRLLVFLLHLHIMLLLLSLMIASLSGSSSCSSLLETVLICGDAI